MGKANDKVLYFAYGSNMNPARMLYRVPNARAVGVGVLNGWVVKERKYADISRVSDGFVNGVVYLMSRNDIEALDHFEGYPCVYIKRWVMVEIAGKKRKALTYILSDRAIQDRWGMPYPEWYREICAEGGRMFGIDVPF